MSILWAFWLFFVIIGLCGAMAWLCDGQPLQPTYKETMLRHAEEQHAAIMNGDERYGIYGDYPPEDLS